MDNFLGAPGKKNSMESEGEHDLTLSLRCGSPKRTTQPFQITNFSFMETHPNPNSSTSVNLNPFLVPSFHHNTNFLLESSSYPPSMASLMASSSNNPPNGASVEVDVNVGSPTPVLRPSRRAPSQGRRGRRKSHTVPAPFPWATDRRAIIHSRNYLLQKNIVSITGMVHCKRCEQEFETSFNLEEKVNELRQFIQKERGSMHDRAPPAWASPLLPNCIHCGRENCAKPILGKKKAINWLFLLLGQMLGCCTLDQLKYFCKHTNNHRTGAKDRLLYLTYMTLYNQLIPDCII